MCQAKLATGAAVTLSIGGGRRVRLCVRAHSVWHEWRSSCCGVAPHACGWQERVSRTGGDRVAADARMEGRWLMLSVRCVRCTAVRFHGGAASGVSMLPCGPGLARGHEHRRLGQEPHSTGARRRRLWCAVCEEREPGPLQLGARGPDALQRHPRSEPPSKLAAEVFLWPCSSSERNGSP